jgi:DNA invertase Pin-like site-specific DNA recombinase
VPTVTRDRVKAMLRDGRATSEIANETGLNVRTIQRIARDAPDHNHEWAAIGTYNDAIAGFTVVQSCACGDVRGVAGFPVHRL